MIIDNSVKAHNTDLLLNADKAFCAKANVSLEVAEAISDYYCAFYYNGKNVAKKRRRMLRIAKTNNLTEADCKALYDRY